MRPRHYLISLLLMTTFALGQEDRVPTVGYLAISADVDLVEIFLDGRSLGRTPIKEELLLAPGWYNLSFFGPEFKWSHWTHRQARTIATVIEAGTYHVLVPPGERVALHMEWMELEGRLRGYERGRSVTLLMGLTMITALFLLLGTAI